MVRMFSHRSSLLVITACIGLAACGEDGDEIVFDSALGPRTETQVRDLPNDLRGPERSNYRSVQQAPELVTPDPAKKEKADGDGR